MERKGLFPNKTALSRHSAWCHIRRRTQIFKMLCFKNEWHYWSENLQKDIFLVYLTSNDNENLVGLVNFDFRILW